MSTRMLLTLCWCVSAAVAAEPIPVKVILESAPGIEVQLEQKQPVPMMVRIVRTTDGLPVAGAKVLFKLPYACGGFMPPCPATHGLFYVFNGINVGPALAAVEYTDCMGLARTQAFKAGTGLLALDVTVSAEDHPSLDLDTSTTPVGERTQAIQIHQVAVSPENPLFVEPRKEFCGVANSGACSWALLKTGFEDGYCGSL